MPRITLHTGAWLFIATWFVHTGDHLRRGLAASSDSVFTGGTFAAILAAVAITLIFTRHAAAPAVAAVIFGAVAVGVSAVHLLPDWGPASDPILVGSNSDGWSIIAVGVEIAAAAVLAVVALRILRAHGFAARIDANAWAPA